jgi:hypothetical protein
MQVSDQISGCLGKLSNACLAGEWRSASEKGDGRAWTLIKGANDVIAKAQNGLAWVITDRISHLAHHPKPVLGSRVARG